MAIYTVHVYSHHWLSDIPACRFVWFTPDFANVSTLVQTARRNRAHYLLPLGARESLSTMTNRTKETTVHFTRAFEIPGFDRPQPAGEYRVDHDEERIEGVSRHAWRRVGTFIHLPAIASTASTRQMVPINPTDLNTALEKDHQQS